MFRRFLFSKIWSSAQDHAVLVLLLNLVGWFISTRPRWSGGNVLYHSCTSFEGASRGGQPLNIFTWFIGAGTLCIIYMHAWGWRRLIGSLIFVGHFPQKSLIFSGSFVEKNLQLRGCYESYHITSRMLAHVYMYTLHNLYVYIPFLL